MPKTVLRQKASSFSYDGKITATTIEATGKGTSLRYLELESELKRSKYYEIITLEQEQIDKWCQSSVEGDGDGDEALMPSARARKQRQRFRNEMCFDALRIKFHFYNPGGGHGGMVLVWKLPRAEEFDDSKEAEAMLKLKDILPAYHTSEMRKRFKQKYSSCIDTPHSVLMSMYRELSEDGSAPTNKAEAAIRARSMEFINSQGDPGLFPEMRALNGRRGHTEYDIFWDEIATIIEEMKGANAQRTGTVATPNQIVSVPSLRREVEKRLRASDEPEKKSSACPEP